MKIKNEFIGVRDWAVSCSVIVLVDTQRTAKILDFRNDQFQTFSQKRGRHPVNLSRSKYQYASNIFWQMFYNQKVLRNIWVNTVFWLFCWELFSRTDTISAVISSTCQWSLENLGPHFSCNLTSNQSKCFDHVNSDGSQLVRGIQSLTPRNKL
jgi:hypothetical protein